MRIVIIGAGFAGMYAALSAARLRDIQGVSPDKLEIALVAPEPRLVVRPRLYEPNPETLTAPLQDIFKEIDVVYVRGQAEAIDTKSKVVEVAGTQGPRKKLSYDRLVVATGSRLFRPNVPALPSTGSASISSMTPLHSIATSMGWRAALSRRHATQSSLQAADSPASRRRQRCRRACARSSVRTPSCT